MRDEYEYPDLEPYDHGMLEVGGDSLYWESCGNPQGKPALVLHGGPGSGCEPWHRRMFDPNAYRIVLFDQRGCGRSTPHASDPATDLTSNTTQSLLADIEGLREHLGIDQWLVWGGSWGCTLALAYAEMHQDRVTELILWGVTTTRRTEIDWLYRGGLAPLFPEKWARFRAAATADEHTDLIGAYAKLLSNPDPQVRQNAALEWCRWESATSLPPPPSGLDDRFKDRSFAMAFARIVTHYVSHAAWLEEGILLRDAARLVDIPGIMVHGRRDLQAPLVTAWELSRVWPAADLVIIEDGGHDPSSRELIRASDRFARGWNA